MDIKELFETARKVSVRVDNDPHGTAAAQMELVMFSIAEVIVTDLHRIADALERATTPEPQQAPEDPADRLL